jgi:hypothetical protein
MTINIACCFTSGTEKIVEIVEYFDTDLEERALGRYDDALAEYVASNGRALSGPRTVTRSGIPSK